MKSVVRNWRDPTCHQKGKESVYKLNSEIVTLARGSQRG